MKRDTLSVIVPALNEDKNIGPLAETISEAAGDNFSDYEIMIFNDGSTDSTGEVAERLAANDSRIRVIHNKEPRCLGGVYNQGRRMAKMEYLMLVNGKNDTTVESLNRIFALRGKCDMVIPHTLNYNERSFVRVFISRAFVSLLNLLFGLDLKYYNHYVLHRREIVNLVDIKTNSYAFQAEALIKLIKMGYSYVQVGVTDVFRKDVGTKIFRFQNAKGVILFLVNIVADVYFGGLSKKEIK